MNAQQLAQLDMQTDKEAAAFQAANDKVTRMEIANPTVVGAYEAHFWIAAREFFSRGSEGQTEEKPKNTRASNPFPDDAYRMEALNFANNGGPVAHVIDRAEAYLSFLRGEPRVIEVSDERVIVKGKDGPQVYHRQVPLDGTELDFDTMPEG